MLDFKPADPLKFAADFFAAMAVKEDMELIRLEGSAQAAAQATKKKKQAPVSVGGGKEEEESRVGPATTRPLDTILYRTLLLECDRTSRQKVDAHARSKGSNARLHELLAEAFVELCGQQQQQLASLAVTSAPCNSCCNLFTSLAADMKIPARAVDQLVRELQIECKKGGGGVTFAQFCGAGRSLAMLPGFLAEAQRLCDKINGRSPERGGAVFGERVGHRAAGIDAVMDAESLFGALPISEQQADEEGGRGKSGRGGEKVGGSAEGGLKEALEQLLRSRGGDLQQVKQIGVYDLISATIKRR
jgi:hypothetical protein